MPENVKLSETVSSISKRFEMTDGELLMNGVQFNEACLTVEALTQEQRQPIATELLAFALELRDRDTKVSEKAVMQLFLLVGIVLEDLEAAERMFATENVDLSKASKFIDNQIQQRPVGTTPLTQGNNLFALLKSKKN